MFKRLFQAVVFFFAVYAFVFVPLGQKTALEHLRAIAGTPAAKNAASELSGGVKRLAHELRNQARRATEAADEQIAGEEGVEPEEPVKPANEPRATSAEDEKQQPDKQRKAAQPKASQRVTRDPAAAASTPNPTAN